jgi:hypothetical protein
MDNAIARERFTFEGREFEAARFVDDSAEPPWEREDGHGPVRFISDSEPLARGEVVLWDAPRGRYVYGFGAALVQAWREGWGLGSEEVARLSARLGKRPTKGQIRAESVRQDMAHLRGFVADEWCYIGVSVRIIGPDGEPEGEDYTHALWGVESSGDYWEEVAREVAGWILSERSERWRAALREARARSVDTRGA